MAQVATPALHPAIPSQANLYHLSCPRSVGEEGVKVVEAEGAD
jgi:hypothetical protein